MAELARWQWDDIGQWRDFAAQYQAEMEAAFQNRVTSVELEIKPHGTFRMDLNAMKQVTIIGRIPGYSRGIRRQCRKIEAGYFILGCEGDVCASDDAVDKIDDASIIDILETVLSKIVDDPEEFTNRSVNLQDEEHKTLARSAEALEFLSDKGFEEIKEGRDRFYVYMESDTGNLKEARKEVKARRASLGKLASNENPNDSFEAELFSNAISSNEVEIEEFSNEVQSGNDRLDTDVLPNDVELVEDIADNDVEINRLVSDKSWVDESPTRNTEMREQVLTLVGHSLNKKEVELDSLSDLLEQAVIFSGFRLPSVKVETDSNSRWLGLAAEPGVSLAKAARLHPGERVIVEDFEPTFVKQLSNGLLRLQDLAKIAPLLDWDKPELPKMLMGRMQFLLAGACKNWCAAAGTSPKIELLHGRALLKLIYGQKPLTERVEVFQKLAPIVVGSCALNVKREKLFASALSGLEKMNRESLRRPFAVHFEGEIAEDHGGPRRDLFTSFGSQLVPELPCLWKRLPRGALVPVADLVAESTPKDNMCGLGKPYSVYRACGRAFGLAARYGEVMGEEVAGFFLHQVARDDTVGLAELQQQLADTEGAEDFRASKDILQKDVREVGLHGLSLSRTITNTDHEVELKEGGKDIPVTNENKAEWLELHLRNKLYGGLSKAADAFREGIVDVAGGSRRTCPLLILLSPTELANLWAGSRVCSEKLSRWREVATVSAEVRQQAAWFWELLEESDEDFRSKVLRFTTGAHRLPDQGLHNFEVQPADGGDESLPKAMTCANMLQMPRYTTKAALGVQLRRAVDLCDGFQVL